MEENDDPQWIRVSAFGIAAAVAAYGAVGLLLAVIGWYSGWLVFGAGTVVLVGLGLLSRPLLPRRGGVSRAAQVCAVLAVAAIVAITAWNVSNAAQQVLIIRDGGTYLNAGKWISAHGTLGGQAVRRPVHGHFGPRGQLRGYGPQRRASRLHARAHAARRCSRKRRISAATA